MQPSIADYGLIGDTRTAALCSSGGSIDWLCIPRFDSQPVFGSLVGGDRGGVFSIAVEGVRDTSRRYRDRSAVVETTWRTGSGTVRLTEGMVVDVSGSLLPQALLVRRLECLSGDAKARIVFDPRLGLPGTPPDCRARHGALICRWGSLALALQTSPDLAIAPGRETTLALEEGHQATAVLSVADRAPVVLVSPQRAYELLETTDEWWRKWSGEASYGGPFPEAVLRSLITLRLLTYSPSGAPVAAPTTSLPEQLGGTRNWDYRFSWPRDAGIGLAAFLGVGKKEEAHSFMHWLLHASRLSRPRLDVLYTIHGRRGPSERELDGVPGFKNTLPVRVGNAASKQHQLDVYGWVLDAAWLLVVSGHGLHAETWRALSASADFVAKNWRRPDAGIWELRGEPRHHVHSKLMAWLALDRALRIAKTHRARKARVARWIEERDALVTQVRARGFDDELGSYVRAYGSRELDAALLILPVLGFEEPGSQRLEATVEAVRRELGAGGGLLYRYRPGTDGLEGSEGAFLPCSFWLVQALALLGRVEEANGLFEELLGMCNDLGLFSEEIDPVSKELLGNFPQAFTHATLMQAALALQEVMGSESPREARRIRRGRTA